MDIEYVKEAVPVDLADYAVANQIADEPPFDWWMSYTLKERNIIISNFKTKFWSTTHKYGLRLPKNVTE